MHRLTRSLLTLVALAMAAMLAAGCSPDDGQPRLYAHTVLPPDGLIAPISPALYHLGESTNDTVLISQSEIEKMNFMGPTILKDADGNHRGVNFSLFSGRASKIRLLLFDNPESDKATREFEMTRLPGTDVWNAFVEGIGLGQHYGYVAWGPNWTFDEAWYPGSIHGFRADVDNQGNRFNPNKLLLDPYCKAIHRDFDWGKGNVGSGPNRASLAYGAAGKCIVVESRYEWSEAEADWRAQRKAGTLKGHDDNELIMYEVHPKGFTANTSSGVLHPGTFRGFGEKAAYFKELGINAVEMLPPYEKPADGGYWGYNNLSYFVPENTYAAKRQREEIIDEFKWMVDQLHQQGIEVIVDVVYNHTGEGGLWREKINAPNDDAVWNLDPEETASLFSFRGLDNDAYYALDPYNSKRTYLNYTGVGNTVRCNNPPVKRLIIDSLRYWVEEFHVDGFRFDLAPALGLLDDNYSDGPQWRPNQTLVQELVNDPVLQRNNTRIISEPWGAGHYGIGEFNKASVDSAKNGALTKGFGWSEWNGTFRDWWRSFANGVTESGEHTDWLLSWKTYYDLIDGGGTLTGSAAIFGESGDGRRPFHSVNFITVHDGMTLYDLVTYPQKVNGCGPLNPICCTSPESVYCNESANSGENNNRSRDWGSEDMKRQMMRNFFAAMLVSHGTPLFFGGDEWMRTQLGNNNTYTPEADNPYSWHDWGTWEAKADRQRMFDFVKKAIQLRKDHAALSPSTYDEAASSFTWIGPSGAPDWNSQTIGMRYANGGNGKALAVLINMGGGDVTYNLGGNWVRLLDTQAYFDTESYLNGANKSLTQTGNVDLDKPEATGSSYGVKSKSIVILEAR
ncbi:MAG: glycosyl hydrolase [Myxococcales bacterium]|jgi:glycogen operon protein|nr:glycosyl hydrolase [Myxococcales bacterium]